MAADESHNFAFERLKADGWHLCPDKVTTEIEEFDKLAPKVALEELKNSDLKHVGVACFPDEAVKVRDDDPDVGSVAEMVVMACEMVNSHWPGLLGSCTLRTCFDNLWPMPTESRPD